ncbi:MAG: succinylglutamate desuccinylase/aspartoacylase family protein, partial [Rhodobacteraceae bacterium]|nr:succinylglutamate desuccinylase/aspartoacylase family protein [Paracoccaceae bacterium]
MQREHVAPVSGKYFSDAGAIMSAAGVTESVYETSRPSHPLRVFRLSGERQGPTLALIGAIHGDEYEGPVVLSQLLARLDPGSLAGRLIVCPAANAAAVATSTRCSPDDGANLAR